MLRERCFSRTPSTQTAASSECRRCPGGGVWGWRSGMAVATHRHRVPAARWQTMITELALAGTQSDAWVHSNQYPGWFTAQLQSCCQNKYSVYSTETSSIATFHKFCRSPFPAGHRSRAVCTPSLPTKLAQGQSP